MHPTGNVDKHSSPASKIALFRSLFRGREDVYARRFENRRTGKAGYAPACANEWVRGICEKPRIKCAECPHQRFLPITDDVIRWHLSGHDDEGRSFVAGIYPMLEDETCWILAADFDKQSWCDDVQAFLETCRRMNLPAAVERSRSGRGGHVWLFFEDAVPAALARQLGSHVLTETMERRPDIGLDSYDRFFPSQDTMPQGGFGNLIALPLQRQPRGNANTVFLDDDLQPYADPWAFLSTVRKIERARVDDIVRDAECKGRIVGARLPPIDEDDDEPWTTSASRRKRETPIAGEMPRELELVLGNEIYITKELLSPGLRNRLIRLAAFQNPEFYKAQALRMSTYGKPRVIACASEHPLHLGLPRGCLDDLLQLLADLKITPVIRDERCSGQPLHVTFQGELRSEQRKAAEAILAHDTGVLSATTAFGKTVIAAWLVAQRGVSTLVLVHRRQLLDQWVERLCAFLNLSRKAIGQIGGGRRKPTGLLDVALIQSLVRKGAVETRVGDYGHFIVDECHHLPAQSFEAVARHARARFVTGLSATVTRKDGHQPIIFMQCGPVRYRVSAKVQAAAAPFAHNVIVRPTAFRPLRDSDTNKRTEFRLTYRQLVEDDTRNRRICEDVLDTVRSGRSPLVLTERREHLERLANLLLGSVQHLVLVQGGMGTRERQAVRDQLTEVPRDEERVVLATGKYIGEGFDDARLDTLFLTLPVSWRGTIAQYVGRLHRLQDEKREVRVYDYADLDVPMLARMFDRRCRGYEALGYTIVVPASAIPGWPGDVVLPADQRWKHDHAASVRRLVRDGLDTPLAHMFAQAALPLLPDIEGIHRARSASEAFLYRRLSTLPETKGRFRLNAELPIPFGSERMEVDLLCDDSRLVVEVDGDQHLGDTDAYRRDRSKDRLLQAHGYFVIRFLAQDVVRDLDTVLDTILKSLVRRRANSLETSDASQSGSEWILATENAARH